MSEIAVPARPKHPTDTQTHTKGRKGGREGRREGGKEGLPQ